MGSPFGLKKICELGIKFFLGAIKFSSESCSSAAPKAVLRGHKVEFQVSTLLKEFQKSP